MFVEIVRVIPPPRTMGEFFFLGNSNVVACENGLYLEVKRSFSHFMAKYIVSPLLISPHENVR